MKNRAVVFHAHEHRKRHQFSRFLIVAGSIFYRLMLAPQGILVVVEVCSVPTGISHLHKDSDQTKLDLHELATRRRWGSRLGPQSLTLWVHQLDVLWGPNTGRQSYRGDAWPWRQCKRYLIFGYRRKFLVLPHHLPTADVIFGVGFFVQGSWLIHRVTIKWAIAIASQSQYTNILQFGWTGQVDVPRIGSISMLHIHLHICLRFWEEKLEQENPAV